jgi:hypothetical protein
MIFSNYFDKPRASNPVFPIAGLESMVVEDEFKIVGCRRHRSRDDMSCSRTSTARWLEVEIEADERPTEAGEAR